MKPIDMSNVQAAGEYVRPEPGAYICGIYAAEDVTEKEYLRITYDIIEGDYKDYYKQLRKDHPDWSNAGTYCRSYKPKALGIFKRFCSAVSKSNGNYVFDAGTVNHDEKTLRGKKVGLVFQEEEYLSNDGSVKTRLIVNREFPISDIDKQKIPPIKKLSDEPAAGSGEWMNVPDGVPEEIAF